MRLPRVAPQLVDEGGDFVRRPIAEIDTPAVQLGVLHRHDIGQSPQGRKLDPRGIPNWHGSACQDPHGRDEWPLESSHGLDQVQQSNRTAHETGIVAGVRVGRSPRVDDTRDRVVVARERLEQRVHRKRVTRRHDAFASARALAAGVAHEARPGASFSQSKRELIAHLTTIGEHQPATVQRRVSVSPCSDPAAGAALDPLRCVQPLADLVRQRTFDLLDFEPFNACDQLAFGVAQVDVADQARGVHAAGRNLESRMRPARGLSHSLIDAQAAHPGRQIRGVWLDRGV